jgi:heme/copper-type cytochrome/quinol oxidase subunit 1
MWKGSITFEPPILFALSFPFLFTIGGFFRCDARNRAHRELN